MVKTRRTEGMHQNYAWGSTVQLLKSNCAACGDLESSCDHSLSCNTGRTLTLTGGGCCCTLEGGGVTVAAADVVAVPFHQTMFWCGGGRLALGCRGCRLRGGIKQRSHHRFVGFRRLNAGRFSAAEGRRELVSAGGDSGWSLIERQVV